MRPGFQIYNGIEMAVEHIEVLEESQHETIILAMDVSGSMRATDVKPNRLVAAQEAAKSFIAGQPLTTRIGVVSFAATASNLRTMRSAAPSAIRVRNWSSSSR